MKCRNCFKKAKINFFVLIIDDHCHLSNQYTSRFPDQFPIRYFFLLCMPSAGGHGCMTRRFVDRLVQTGAALAVIEKRHERAAAKQAWVADVSAPRPGRAGL